MIYGVLLPPHYRSQDFHDVNAAQEQDPVTLADVPT